MKDIRSFKAMDILEKSLDMEDIVHLEVGEPDFDTPLPIKEEGIRAIREEKIGYTHSLGMKPLREAVAAYYNRSFGTSVNYRNVVVSSGTSPALLLAVSVLLEHSGKKQILTANPGYAGYPNFIRFLSGEVANYNLIPENRFRIDFAAIRKLITEDTAAILINSPNNPLGTVISPEDMGELGLLGIPVISDEIYQGMVYEGKKYDSILSYTDNAIALNGFSKLYAMTGWRLGYLIVPDRYLDLAHRLEQNLFISANTISQYAAITALTDPAVQAEVQERIEDYGKRRDFTLKVLSEHGLKPACDPAGAYYIILDVREYTDNSLAFSYELLENAKVAVTPGIDFGTNLEGHIRISYSASPAALKEGIRRIAQYLKERR